MKKTSLVLAIVLGLFVLILTTTAGISYAMSQEDEALIGKIDGRRYTFDVPLTSGINKGGIQTVIIDVKGKTFVRGNQYNGSNYTHGESFEIQGRVTRRRVGPQPGMNTWIEYCTYTISDDGEIITESAHWSSGAVSETVYFWQK